MTPDQFANQKQSVSLWSEPRESPVSLFSAQGMGSARAHTRCAVCCARMQWVLRRRKQLRLLKLGSHNKCQFSDVSDDAAPVDLRRGAAPVRNRSQSQRDNHGTDKQGSPLDFCGNATPNACCVTRPQECNMRRLTTPGDSKKNSYEKQNHPCHMSLSELNWVMVTVTR